MKENSKNMECRCEERPEFLGHLFPSWPIRKVGAVQLPEHTKCHPSCRLGRTEQPGFDTPDQTLFRDLVKGLSSPLLWPGD